MMMMLVIRTMENTNWNTTSERRMPVAEIWLVKFPLMTLIA